VLFSEVRLEPEHFLEVVRADFDAGFPHFEGRFRHWVAPLLGDQHAQIRRFAMQLTSERQACETAAEDHCVVVLVVHWNAVPPYGFARLCCATRAAASAAAFGSPR
jgi:hypothetical protein